MSGLQGVPSTASAQVEDDDFEAMLAKVKADFHRDHGREATDEEAFDLLISYSPRAAGAPAANVATAPSKGVAVTSNTAASPVPVATASVSVSTPRSHDILDGLESDGNESDASNRSYTARLRNPEEAYFQVDVDDLESRIAGLLKQSAEAFQSPPHTPRKGSPRAEDVVAGHVRDVLRDHHGRAATSEEVGSALVYLLPAIAAAKSDGEVGRIVALNVALLVPLCLIDSILQHRHRTLLLDRAVTPATQRRRRSTWESSRATARERSLS